MARADKYGLLEIPAGDPFGGPPAGLRQDPITALLVAGTAMSAIGAIQQGRAQKAAADYNATINMQNAEIARRNAALEEKQAEREDYLRLGAIRAAQGKAGGMAGEGSVLDVLGDVAAQGELERQNIIYRGELNARGFTNTAQLDRFSGKQAQRAGYMKAGSELLTGGAQAYSAYTKLGRTGGSNSGYSDFVSGYTPRNYGDGP